MFVLYKKINNEYLDTLLDYNYGRKNSLNIMVITIKEVETLIKENKVVCIFGILEHGVTEPWHFIIGDNNLCYVLSEVDDEHMDYLVGNLIKTDNNKYIEVESRELDYIYSLKKI